MAPALMHMQWQYNMLRSHFLFPSLDVWPVRLSHPHAVDQTTRVHSFSYVSCVALKTCIPFITTRARRTHTEHTLNTQYTCAWMLTEVDGTHKMLCCALTALSITIRVHINRSIFLFCSIFIFGQSEHAESRCAFLCHASRAYVRANIVNQDAIANSIFASNWIREHIPYASCIAMRRRMANNSSYDR